MAYPAILGRRFDLPIINLGFSGNAHCEPEIASLLADLDPVVYVLDPLPNMSAGSVAERMPLLLTKLRAAHSRTPIILVENTEVGNGEIAPSKRTGYTKANTELRRIFQQRVRAGDEALFYISGAKLLNDDGQDTVDGVHPTDLGFIHMAEAMEPTLKRAIRAAARRP
jgi:lysophospholipase L1-like esterase